MKTFLNPEPFKVEVQNVKGEIKQLVAKNISSEGYEELTKILEGKIIVENPDGTKTEKSKSAFVMMREQMAFIFGGVEQDYKEYDNRIIRDVLNYFNVEMANPIKAREEVN